MNCNYIKSEDNALFKNSSKRPAFVLRPLKYILNFEVHRLSLQQLEYKMDHTGYPVDYIYSEIGYFGNPNFPYANIQFKQATN